MKIKMKKTKPNKAAVCELSSLDDWTLLKLLDQVPLTDLLRLGQVNRRFNQLVKQNCRYSVRRHIVLAIGSGQAASSSDQFNCITVAQLDYIASEGIRQLLPYTTSLKIVYENPEDDESEDEVFHNVIYLLEGWIDQLVVFDLVFSYNDVSSTYILSLFDLLNRMHQLKELHIRDLNNMFIWMELHLSIISQLQVFTFITSGRIPWIIRQLCTHATNTLREVNLGGFYDFAFHDQLLDVPPHLAITFKQLLLCFDELSPNLVALCELFPSLHTLCIPLSIFTVGQFSRALVLLPALTELTIFGNFACINGIYGIAEPVEPDVSEQLVPLPTVTSLKLKLILGSHADLERLHLSELFPNLVTLNIGLLCFGCSLKAKRCLKMLQAKGKFGELLPKLRTVLFYGKPLPEKDWQPSPPKTLIDRVDSFLCRIPKRLRKLAGKVQKAFQQFGCA